MTFYHVVLCLPYKSAYGHQAWQDCNLPIKSHDTLIRLSWKIMWQTKIITYPLKSPWPLNLRGWRFTLRGFYLWSHIKLWLRGLARSHEKLKPLYLYDHSVYRHQTCQCTDTDFLWSHGLAKSCDKLKSLYSDTSMSFTSKLARLEALGSGAPII